MAKDPASVYQFDSFSLDVINRRLSFRDAVVSVPPKALDTLILLLAHAGNLIRKDDIHTALWPNTFVEDVTLARVISDLRHLLAQYSTFQYIETVPKHGYRFAIRPRVLNRTEMQPTHMLGRMEEADAANLSRRAWHAASMVAISSNHGLKYARDAIAADPSYAEGHAVLAYLYLYAGFGFLPGADAFPRAQAAAATALSLDPNCAPAIAISGMLKMTLSHDMQVAEQLFKRAIEVAPESMPGHFGYSHLLLISGRFEEALEQGLIALQIDPLSCPLVYHADSGAR